MARRAAAGFPGAAASARAALRRAFAVGRAPGWITAAVLLLALAAVGGVARADDAEPFDHLRTGFLLTGTHATLRCESCHLRGIFKGTPRDCGGCHLAHNPRSATAPPPDHLQAGPACDLCHTTSTFRLTRYHHAAVPPGTCANCHDGIRAAGKPAGHVVTTASCDQCHLTSAFTPLRAAQFGVATVPGPRVAAALLRPGGLERSGRLPPPLPVPGTAAVAGGGFDHRGVLPGQCRSCHDGRGASGPPGAPHTGLRLSCDACHRSTAWTPAQFLHQGVMPGQCRSCHNGALAGGQPPGHFVTVRSCDGCHRTIAWQPVGYAHLSAQYRPDPARPACVDCHLSRGELIPRQLRANPRLRPVPVR